MTKEKLSMSSEEMISTIANILKNGLKLGEMDDEERRTYQADLISHLSSSPLYTAFYDAETKTIMIETTYFDPLLCVDVTSDSIYFLPLTEKGYYQPFMKVFEFIMLDRKKKKSLLKEELKLEEEEPKEKPNFDFL